MESPGLMMPSSEDGKARTLVHSRHSDDGARCCGALGFSGAAAQRQGGAVFSAAQQGGRASTGGEQQPQSQCAARHCSCDAAPALIGGTKLVAASTAISSRDTSWTSENRRTETHSFQSCCFYRSWQTINGQHDTRGRVPVEVAGRLFMAHDKRGDCANQGSRHLYRHRRNPYWT